MNLLLLANIASAFSTLASNPAFGQQGNEISAIAGLVGMAFNLVEMNDEDRKDLLEQIKEANDSGRGALTQEQEDEWKARHEAAKEIIDSWKPGT